MIGAKTGQFARQLWQIMANGSHCRTPRFSYDSSMKKQIAIVEDEPALRELVVNILELYGYRTYEAGTGVAALPVWEKHKDEIDLLLTDMVMPEGMSGRQLAERLQAEDPGLKVIYTSGYSPGMAGKDIALLEGFNFLAKPYPPNRLALVPRVSGWETRRLAGTQRLMGVIKSGVRFGQDDSVASGRRSSRPPFSASRRKLLRHAATRQPRRSRHALAKMAKGDTLSKG
jgi:CheY-like chemotaxis protein